MIGGFSADNEIPAEQKGAVLMALAKGFSTIEAAAEAAVRPIVESHGYTLWDVWFVKEGAKWYLRIFIDSSSSAA